MSQRATWTGDAEWALKTGDSLMWRSLPLAMMPELCGDPTDRSRYWGTLQGYYEVVPAVMTPPLLIAL